MPTIPKKRGEMEWDTLVRRPTNNKIGNVCAQCLRPRLGGEYACPCGSVAYTSAIDSTMAPRMSKLVRKIDRAISPASGPIAHFTKDGAGLLYHLWGGPGSGKTTIGYLTFPYVHIISAEMSLERVAAYSTRLKAKIASVSVPKVVAARDSDASEEWDLGIPANHTGPVVLDSATALGTASDAALEQLHEYRSRTGSPCIIIGQATKAGEAWGSARLAHAVDVVIELGRHGSTRYARCTKNRAGDVGMVDFQLGALGASLGAAKGLHYSVESERGGGYRLVAWPDDSAKWAAPWQMAEGATARAEKIRSAVEGGGYATAAKRSRLAPSGWAFPEDLEERRKYAEEAGLIWFDPTDYGGAE